MYSISGFPWQQELCPLVTLHNILYQFFWQQTELKQQQGISLVIGIEKYQVTSFSFDIKYLNVFFQASWKNLSQIVLTLIKIIIS